MTSRRRRGGFTLPEVLVTAGVLLLLMGILAAVLTMAERSRSRVDQRVDVQVEAREWLARLGDDLASSARRRLFPGRCEMDLFVARDLLRFDPTSPDQQYDASSRTARLVLDHPVGQPASGWERALAAFDFDRGEALEATWLEGRLVRLRFPSEPVAGDRILVEYPVNHLLVWWLEPSTGLVRREFRDSQGGTAVEVLNPADRSPRVRCEALEVTEAAPGLARIRVRARGEAGDLWEDSLDVAVPR